MDFSKKSVKTAAGLFFAIFLITYAIFIFNADNVYFLLSGKSYIKKIHDDRSFYPKGNLEMRFVFDYPPVNNAFEEGKGFRGRLVGVLNKKGNIKVRVFFRSAVALYEVIENNCSFWANPEKNVVNFFASTAGLENGVYQIGLDLSDDRGERFAWIDSFFEKASGGPMEYVARPVAPLLAKISKDLKFGIEKFDRKYKEIVCKGWIRLDGADMNDFNAYLLIKDSDGILKTFYTPLYTRMDLASKTNNLRTANCGFRIKVPADEFPPDNYMLSMVLRSRKTGKCIGSAQNEKIDLLPSVFIGTVALIAPPFLESKEIRKAINVGLKSGKYQKISGWAYVINHESRGQKVYVQFEKPDGTFVHYITFPVERPDVGKYFKNALYNYSGFITWIPLKDVPDIDSCNIRLILDCQNGNFICQPPTRRISTEIRQPGRTRH
jgi:hypothetical protein